MDLHQGEKMKLNNITKKYNDNCILDNIELSLTKCGMVFVLGPSGSGKSTLLNILGLLDKDYQGDITIFGETLDKKESSLAYARKNHLGFIFQDFNLINSLTVKENILTSLNISDKPFDEEKYKKTFALLGLDKLENRDVTTLSGGEKQRVAIARAILRNSKIILADEPTGNLDAENTKVIFDTLKEFSKDKLIIVVSHDNDAAQQYADCIITLKNKKTNIVKNDTYLSNPELKNDEVQETSEKSKKWIRRISLNNLKRRKRKLVPLFFISMFSLLFAGMVMGIFSTINNMCFSTNSILETDKYSILKKDDPYSFDQVDGEIVKEVSDNVRLADTVEYYYDSICVMGDSESVFLNYTVIKDDEFFRKRLSDNLNGSFINNDNEVIINQNLSEQLFDSKNSVGKEVTIISNQREYSCKISGVLKVSFNNSQPIIMVSEALSKKFGTDLAKGETVSLVALEGDHENLDMVNTTLDAASPEQKIVSGRMPDNKNEAIISVHQFNRFISLLFSDNNNLLSIEDIRKDLIPDDIKKTLPDKLINVSSSTCTLGKIKIVGIYDCENADDGDVVYINENTFKEFNSPKINRIDIYVYDLSVSDILTKIADDHGHIVEQPTGPAAVTLAVQLQTIIMLLGVICIIIITITCFMIHFSTKMNIKDRIYEVGVIKSLGSDNNSIFRMFINENIIISIITSAAASVLLILISVLNSSFGWLTVNGIPVLTIEWWHIAVIFVLNLIITLLSALKETIKVSRMNIIDALRNKYQ